MATGLDLIGSVRITNVTYPKIFFHPKLGNGIVDMVTNKALKPKRLVRRQDERFFMFDVASMKPSVYSATDARFDVTFEVVKTETGKEIVVKGVNYHARRRETQAMDKIEERASIPEVGSSDDERGTDKEDTSGD